MNDDDTGPVYLFALVLLILWVLRELDRGASPE